MNYITRARQLVDSGIDLLGTAREDSIDPIASGGRLLDIAAVVVP